MNSQLAMTSASVPAGSAAQADQAGRDLLERSSLYGEFLVEREEILRHKWLVSEKAGRDIGFDSALFSWVVHHRARWRRVRLFRLGENANLKTEDNSIGA